MKKILLLDWDIHAERYYNFFLFQKNVNIEVLPQNNSSNLKSVPVVFSLDINQYDMIIFPRPLDFSKWALDFIVKNEYKGLLIIEKMLAKKTQEAKEVINKLLLGNVKFIFFHSRRYDPTESGLLVSESNTVLWPNQYETNMDPIYNVLPNFYDLVYNSFHSTLQINNACICNNRLLLRFNSIIDLYIYDDKKSGNKVKINNKIIEWPNYFLTMEEFFKRINYCDIDFKENIEYELQVIHWLEKITLLLNDCNLCKFSSLI